MSPPPPIQSLLFGVKMTYVVTVRTRFILPILGRAYPSLELEGHRIEKLLRNYLYQIIGVPYKIDQSYIDVSLNSKWSRITVKTRSSSSKHEYRAACAIEKWANELPYPLPQPLGVVKRVIAGGRPTDNYLIDIDHDKTQAGEIIDWLSKNAKRTDFQFYTKFGNDVTLGFRNLETAAMFKMTFGETVD